MWFVYCFLPRNVYKSEGGKPIIVNLDACTNCKLCELRCPDYAIIVGGEENSEKSC